MTRTEGLSTGSFVERAHSTKTNGTMTFIMVILLSMMLLLWQQNCRLPRGHNPTSHPVAHVWWAFGSKAISDELRGNNILVWGQRCCHGKVLCHGSPKRGSDMVFLPSARDNHIMAEAEGHASHQLPRLLDEASHRSGLVSMHTRPWGVPAGLRPKVPAFESSSAYSACRCFEPGGSLDRRVNCRRVPQPRWVGTRRSAKGKKPEGDRRERWNPATFVFVPRPGRVRLQ
jgi:hypothetical protein